MLDDILRHTISTQVYRFSTDTEAELNLVKELCTKNGAFAAVVANHWAKGGSGAMDLGSAVIEACAASRLEGSPFRYLESLIWLSIGF